MIALRFCTNSINILKKHRCKNVIEIKRIDLILLEDIKTDVEMVITLALHDLFENKSVNRMRHLCLKRCEILLRHLGYEDKFEADHTTTEAPKVALGILRKTVLLLDMALVSYVKSHGSSSDTSRLEMKSVDVSDGEELLGFTCSWMKLACLDAFLDGRQVWVFEFSNAGPVVSHLKQDTSAQTTSVLARMSDLADIWGPVYTVPTESGLIKHYVVSKGVICRINTKQQCIVPGAVQCHYYSRASFFRRKVSRLVSTERDLLLAEDDLLLIGGGLKENHYCDYKLSHFSEDFASDFTVLGTHESVWKLDSRSGGIGISKLLGITVSGTQKLIPQTTLKQHLLDKWTASPLRANPAIFNQSLGVEISHCTGNARRVSLSELMISYPVCRILERQSPGWTMTSWGSRFNSALFEDDREANFRVWKDFASERAKMADLLCCLLDLLDHTGLAEGKKFHAAMLYDNEEYALPIHTDINDWSISLRDTHITATYAIITEICLNCEVPDHSTSSCDIPKAYTVLQTQYATKRPDNTIKGSEYYILRPDGPNLKQVDCGSPDICLLTPTSSLSKMMTPFRKPGSCLEIRDQSSDSTTNTVYLRASNRSFHGKNRPKSNVTLAPLEKEGQGLATNKHLCIQKQREDSALESQQIRHIQLEAGFRSQSDEPSQSQPARPVRPLPRDRVNRPPRHLESAQDPVMSTLPTPNRQPGPSQLHERQSGQNKLVQNEKCALESPLLTPSLFRSYISSSGDENFIMSDVYGETSYPPSSSRPRILDDLANYDLLDDDGHGRI